VLVLVVVLVLPTDTHGLSFHERDGPPSGTFFIKNTLQLRQLQEVTLESTPKAWLEFGHLEDRDRAP
jgi:hypothetical protein